MKLEVRYSNGIIHNYVVVGQTMFERFQFLSEKDSNVELTDEEKNELKSLKWIKPLKKDNKLCTTNSPIYKANENGGILDLSPNQGIHKIETRMIK